jgi:SAM-dependent methyltransferase
MHADQLRAHDQWREVCSRNSEGLLDVPRLRPVWPTNRQPEPYGRGMQQPLRETFGEVAELYDRVRPGYPAEVFAALGVGAGSRVLEIGPGTGQATRALAELGCSVVAVELGAELASVARRRLAGFPAVEVVTADFETWDLPAEPFDLALAATAFHWIDPAIRVEKSADALRVGGTLATIATHHVAGGSLEFFAEVQDCYERFDPATPAGLRLRPAAEIPEDREEIERSARFGAPLFARWEWEQSYSTDGYIDLLLTYSGHRALPDDARAGLLSCIRALIERHGGRITKRYLTELRTATRLR